MLIKDDLYYLRDVNKEEGPSKVKQCNISFLEASKKWWDNIKNAFTWLIEKAYKVNISKDKNNEQIKEKKDNGINLANQDEEEPNKKDGVEKI